MKIVFLSAVLLLAIISFTLPKVSALENESKVILYLFWGNGCPHCAQMDRFLNGLEEKYPVFEVKKFEVYSNQTNRELFESIAKAHHSKIQGVPTAFIDKKIFVGYSNEIGIELENRVIDCIKNGCVSPQEISNDNESASGNISSFSSYENTKSGLTIFIVMVVLFVSLIVSLGY